MRLLTKAAAERIIAEQAETIERLTGRTPNATRDVIRERAQRVLALNLRATAADGDTARWADDIAAAANDVLVLTQILDARDNDSERLTRERGEAQADSVRAIAAGDRAANIGIEAVQAADRMAVERDASRAESVKLEERVREMEQHVARLRMEVGGCSFTPDCGRCIWCNAGRALANGEG